MKIAILGFGREGQSVYRHLKSKRTNDEIWILDKNLEVQLPKGALSQIGPHYLDNLSRFDVMYKSPGIPHRTISGYKGKISSATKLFFKFCPCKIIGVTGTKGKGTTATLLHNILKACGEDVYLVGNMGNPALNILHKLKRDSWVVFELSSFQLRDLRQSPTLAVVLDIFPDHQDYHQNYKEYVKAKKNIYRYQKDGDKVFFAKDINLVEFNFIRLKIPGEHNLKNAAMTYLVAKELGCPKNKILEEIFKFKGNEHRLELARAIANKNGSEAIRFYNDSASTNPQTTLAAVRAFRESKILIAGGSDKDLDYKIWAEEFPKQNIKAMILMGKNKNKIISSFDFRILSFSINIVNNLEEAMKKALKLATAGDIILFSPGSASFDMFKDYNERGKRFKEIVKSL